MALPADVGTFTLTGGSFTDVTGATALAGLKGTLTPVDGAGRPMNVIHAASGKVIVPVAVAIEIQDDGTWSVGPLPYTDDAALASPFRYKVAWAAASSAPSPGNKIFEVPTGSGSTVDFDLLGSASGTTVTPVAVPLVTSVAGESGAVTSADIATALDTDGTRLSDAELKAAFGPQGGLYELRSYMTNPLGVWADGDDLSYAFDAALADMTSKGGGTLQIPGGTLRLADDVTAVPNVTIAGAGRGRTMLMAEKNGFTFVSGSQAAPIQNFALRDLTIDGANQTAIYKGVAMQYLSRCSFTNLHIKNTQATGLGIDYLVNCYIANVITENTGLGNDGTMPGGNGIGIGIGGFSSQEESFLVVGCTALNAKRAGIMIERSGLASPKGAKVIGCYAFGCGDTGFEDAGGCGAIFTGNVASQNVGYGFAINQGTIGASGPGYMGQCVGNYSFKNGKAGIVYDASLLAPNGPGYLIANNAVDNNNGEGIYLLLGAATWDAQGLSVHGNTVRKNALSGLRLRGTGTGKFTDLTIAGNTILGNGTAGGSGVNNLRIEASISGGTIADNSCPADSGSPTAASITTISGKTLTDVVFRGNTARGAATKWAVAGTLTNCVIEGNLGYNPQGPVAVTVGASPWTYTAGPTPETLYIDGGTVSAIVKGGVTLRTSTGTAVPLRPNGQVTVTYSAAPTVTADRL